MKANHWRYIVEFPDGDPGPEAAENARLVYAEVPTAAEKDPAVTHMVRLGIALNFSVFRNKVLSDPLGAFTTACTAFEDGTAGLDNVAEDSYRGYADPAAVARPPDVLDLGRRARRERAVNSAVNAAARIICMFALCLQLDRTVRSVLSSVVNVPL
mmetsp:Transcript_62298/g.193079  ORF Transcript_62298/g.193079 Transcript_62298/m.193079 type:complete len:156 (+) Transcript_62298:539-1006(+)